MDTSGNIILCGLLHMILHTVVTRTVSGKIIISFLEVLEAKFVFCLITTTIVPNIDVIMTELSQLLCECDSYHLNYVATYVSAYSYNLFIPVLCN